MKEEVEALLNTARDAEEDARFGESLRGDELPEELRRREDRLAAIVAAKERLEAAQREARAGAARSGSVIPKAGGHTSALMVNPRTRRRATSPTPTVPS